MSYFDGIKEGMMVWHQARPKVMVKKEGWMYVRKEKLCPTKEQAISEGRFNQSLALYVLAHAEWEEEE